MAQKLTKESIDRFYDYDLFLETRTLYMGSQDVDDDGIETGTDYAMCEKVIKGLHILEHKSHEEIRIIMNNLGGDDYHGAAIVDSIRACKSPVTILFGGRQCRWVPLYFRLPTTGSCLRVPRL